MANTYTIVLIMVVFAIAGANGRKLEDSSKEPTAPLSITEKSTTTINNELRSYLEQHNHADIMIVMAEGTKTVLDEFGANNGTWNPAQTQIMMEKLIRHAAKSQERVHQVLDKRPGDYEGKPTYFWIQNEISVTKASKNLIEDLARMPEIQEIRLPEIIHLDSK